MIATTPATEIGLDMTSRFSVSYADKLIIPDQAANVARLREPALCQQYPPIT